jgi:hypothetical protein
VAGFLFRLLLVDGAVLALVLSFPATPDRGALAVAWLLARAAYTFGYETGYFVNDFWAAPREGRPASVPAAGTLAVAVALRIAAVATALLLLPATGPAGAAAVPWTLGALALGLVIFGVHNAIFFPWRIPTFAALYLVRYALAVPLLRPDAVPEAAVVGSALTGGFVVKYWADRRPDHPAWGLWDRTRVTLVLRVATLLLAAFAVAGLALPGVDAVVPAASAVALLLLDGGYLAAQAAAAVAGAFRRERREIRHLHTRLSHDATLEVEELARFLRASGRSALYLSEHAEDVGPEQLEELRAAAVEEGGGIHVGVEVTVLDQHVLLEEIREWNGPQRRAWDVAELRRRRDGHARAIWAHPHFSIRRLLGDREYRRGFLELSRAVDGVEIVNRKSDRTWNHAWRSLLIGLLAVADHRCRLTVGLDAHHPEDLQAALRREA